jgi:hypothetical protein
MTRFYRGPDAEITDEVVEVHRPVHRTYLFSELGDLRTAARRAGGPFLSLAPVAVLATVLACGSLLVGLAAGPMGYRSVSVLAAALTVTATVLSVACWRSRRRHYGVWATYRGRQVCLLETTNRLAFGQISRAIRRVLEYHSDNDQYRRRQVRNASWADRESARGDAVPRHIPARRRPAPDRLERRHQEPATAGVWPELPRRMLSGRDPEEAAPAQRAG